MMRPYIAVIGDSFREALASRVLWLLLGLITLVLLAIIPFGVQYPTTIDFTRRDVDDMQGLAQDVVAGGRESTNSPRRSVWDSLSEDLQKSLSLLATTNDPSAEMQRDTRGDLLEELNETLMRDDWFTAEQLAEIDFRKEGRSLLRDHASLTKPQLARLNRLALANLYPPHLAAGPGESVQIRYLTFDVGGTLAMSRKRLEDQVRLIVAGAMNFIGATFGVFAAILVTASIIPNMFDAGSVNLLFSKPILRPLLYLAKFIGGCWFVLINAAYLIVGIYLVVGWRFGVWNPRVLWAIPILMFLFAVYYSVSAFAGVIWRNTIISVVAPILLWAACFGIGLSHDFMEALGNQPRRIVRIVPANDDVITVAESGASAVWNANDRKWSEVFAPQGNSGVPAFAQQNRLLGPLYDPVNQRIVAIDRNFGQSKVFVGTKANDWERELADAAPSGCVGLLPHAPGEFVVVERDGISLLRPTTEDKSLPINIFGLKYNVGPKRGSFQPIGPRPHPHAAETTAAAINPDDKSIVMYGNGIIQRLTLNEETGKYQVATEREILSGQREALLASTGSCVLIVDEDGQIQLLDSTTLDPRSQSAPMKPMKNVKPRFAAASSDGRYVAVLFHNRSIWLYDLANQRDVSSTIGGQGDITAMTFVGDDVLYVADRVDRVRKTELPDGTAVETLQPKATTFDNVFRWLVNPIYSVFPKPSKLKETSVYLLTEQETITNTENTTLEGSRIQIDPWSPVWTSAIFMGVMLLLACIYIQRVEF